MSFNLEQQLKLELESRNVRSMCEKMSRAELIDLICMMHRSDTIKNDFMKTLLLGDFSGAITEPTAEELDALASWIIGD